MDRSSQYPGTREELLLEIAEASTIVLTVKSHHDDPVEDLRIRGIWTALLDLLLTQLEAMDQEQGKLPLLSESLETAGGSDLPDAWRPPASLLLMGQTGDQEEIEIKKEEIS